ncbi:MULTISPECIES: hypothetical protein [Chelativorans]|jgi:hypothetical protein|uniref:hypothetical protein n=1 Tax=Chelativorans TaxID=449972 RepID=UPI00005440CF|nr:MULTISPECIES: hypothetical protein [Chelativorans]
MSALRASHTNELDPGIHALLRRCSEIAGEILHLDSQVKKLRADLKHLDAALKVMGYVNEDALPVRKACTSGIFHRKELGRPAHLVGSDIRLT